MNHDIDKEERRLFRQALADVLPLPQDKAEPKSRRPPPEPRQTQRDEKAVLEELRSAPLDFSGHATGDELLYARAGIAPMTLRRLRRGRYSIEGQLDLHGMTADQAFGALADYLRLAVARRWRCVRIIHGKGNGSPHKRSVLKDRVQRQLRLHGDVLAFCSTPPHDGGTGAVYVLLRKRR